MHFKTVFIIHGNLLCEINLKLSEYIAVYSIIQRSKEYKICILLNKIIVFNAERFREDTYYIVKLFKNIL